MTTGTYISGAAHLAFILVLLFGGIFSRSSLPEMTVADVSVISEAEFAALTRPAAAPSVTETATQPTPPVPDATPPETPAPDAAPATPPPAQTETPEAPEPVPETPELIVPDAEVSTEAPVIQAPPTLEDGDTLAPDATPAPAPRVAPDPSPMPTPEAETAPEVVEETAPAPDPVAETVVEETTAAAPEAATTEIVTEAETPKELAPTESIRPRSRPAPPVRQAETPTPATPPRDAIADAVAAAVADTAAEPMPSAPTGPPLTAGEKDALRVAVQQCWNVGSLSTDALRTTVIVTVSVSRDGRPDSGSIRMAGFEGGTESSARQAFEAARRAIIRCGANGFNLPADKYDQWRDIEMTFNPERMRIK